MGTKSPAHSLGDLETAEAALRLIVAELGGRMPTRRELSKRKLTSLSIFISGNGGSRAVAEKLGIDLDTINVPRHHYDDFKNVRVLLLPITRELGGNMPTKRYLGARGLNSIAVAIRKHGGMAAVAKMLGICTDGIMLQKGHYRDLENVRAALLPIIAELGGRMPTSAYLRTHGLSSLAVAIGKLGGPLAVAIKLGLPTIGVRERGSRVATGHWKDFVRLEALLRPIVEELRRMPSEDELYSRNLGKLCYAIRKYHGGFPAVATRLGLDPVTQRTIEDRADKVARAYLALDLEDDAALWEAMARRWLTRDLDAALAAFEKDGTLDAFRKLLADP